MLAVIKTGGKQYLVKPGDKIEIEKIEKNEGEEIIFDEVLLSEKDGKIEIGNPLVKGAKVFGKITKQGKGDKDIIFRYKAKTRRRTKRGHRQFFTEVEITKIGE
jgi:large subunit ribosomal protein L21